MAPTTQMGMTMTTKGGITQAKKIANYSPPKGPTSIKNRGPGLGGTNHGPCGTQGMRSETDHEGGRSGLHGQRFPRGAEKG